MLDRFHLIEGIERDIPEQDRNLANMMLQLEREEQELEEDGELPPEMISRIKKKKIGKSKRCCPVCLGPFQKGILENKADEIARHLPCQHLFHNECIKNWFKKKSVCPICRMDMKKHYLTSPGEEELHHHEGQ